MWRYPPRPSLAARIASVKFGHLEANNRSSEQDRSWSTCVVRSMIQACTAMADKPSSISARELMSNKASNTPTRALS
eukprot:3753431-Rhodomonas_salina.2